MFNLIEKMIRSIEKNNGSKFQRSGHSKEFNQAIDDLYRALKNVKKFF